MKQAIEIALKTWYPKDDGLHFNPHHPLGKLLGEWGELLDDYMKSLYKPGYIFEPEDELGDIWYYLRILCYQINYTPVNLEISIEKTEELIALTIWKTARTFHFFMGNYTFGGAMSKDTLDWSYSALVAIARRYNLTLDDLTHSNWEKLKPGSERGGEWMKTRG